MIRTTSDLTNSLMREVRHWRIKVVPDIAPNDDGFWVTCGTQQFPEKEPFRHTAIRLRRFVPANHHIVAIEST